MKLRSSIQFIDETKEQEGVNAWQMVINKVFCGERKPKKESTNKLVHCLKKTVCIAHGQLTIFHS